MLQQARTAPLLSWPGWSSVPVHCVLELLDKEPEASTAGMRPFESEVWAGAGGWSFILWPEPAVVAAAAAVGTAPTGRRAALIRSLMALELGAPNASASAPPPGYTA